MAIPGNRWPPLEKKWVVVFAADHGVVAEGVSAYPQDVTYQMVLQFSQGGAGINVLARHAGARVEVVDIGVNHDFAGVPDLIPRKVAYGTRNMAQEPAMTREEALRALLVGVERAEAATAAGDGRRGRRRHGHRQHHARRGPGLGLYRAAGGAVTGRGTGIDDKVLQHKIAVINRALALHRPQRRGPGGGPGRGGGPGDCRHCRAHPGNCAAARRPVMLDGFIATAGALVAAALAPAVTDYLIAAHRSVEPGHQIMLDFLGLKPLLNLKMRLGEGTGAALGLNLLEAGVRIYREMATFEEAGVAERARGQGQ